MDVYGHTIESVQADVIKRDTEPMDPGTGPATLGEQDRALLDALAADGRAPHARLAQETGWSAARVKRRIAALEGSGALIFDVDLLPALLGFSVNAVFWLTMPPRHLAAVAEEIAAHEQVASVVALSGRNNLMAVVICRDVEDLYRYIAERLAGIENIQSYDVSIRAQRLKQAGSIIAHGRLVQHRSIMHKCPCPPRVLGGTGLVVCVRRCPTFPPCWVVSSALAGLASGFGMGPGVSLSLWPP